MSKKQKKFLKRIIISFLLFIIIFIIDTIVNLSTIIKNESFGFILPLCLYLVIYIYIGYDIIKKAFKNIFYGRLLDENFLMAFATICAFIIKKFPEAVAVLLFYQIGEFFQSYAVGKSRKSIASLMDIRPEYANLLLPDGTSKTISPEEVKAGDIILIKPGEKIPLDGVILKGEASVDCKALTGESLPVEVKPGSKLISGTINLDGLLEVKVLTVFYESTVSKILDLVENASSKKSRSENFITKFAKYYTPIVVFLAFMLAIVPGFITRNWHEWIYRALDFLVVSCPCALVVSIPLTFFTGIGFSSKKGILVKGSSYLEKFNQANIFVFDKTGTLTKGNFVVAKICPEERKNEILEFAAIAEANSTHPISESIKKAYGKEIDHTYNLINVAGKGVIAKKDDTIICGNEKLMVENSIDIPMLDEVGTIVYVAKNNRYIGYLVIEDEIKESAKTLINYLNDNHIESIMLTGDNEKIASKVASELGVSKYRASLLPQNKVEEVEKIFAEKKESDVVCFVGDGINDAPVLMRSDIGIAMGGVGTDAAIEASDIVLMHDDLNSLIDIKKIAKKTMRIVYENICFAIGVKILILILSALGITGMWFAIFGDVGVLIIAILNAMRTGK